MNTRVDPPRARSSTSTVVLDAAGWVVVRDLVRVLPLPAPFAAVPDPMRLPEDLHTAAVAALHDAGVLRATAPPRLAASLQRALLAHARPDGVLDLELRRGDEVVVARFALLRERCTGLVWRPAVDADDPRLAVRDTGTVTLVTTGVDTLLDLAVELVPAPDRTPAPREVGRERLVDAIAALTPQARDEDPTTTPGPLPEHVTRFAPLTGSLAARVGAADPGGPGGAKGPGGEVRWLHDGHDWWEVEARRDGQLALRPTGRDRLRAVLVAGLARRVGAPGS